MKYATEEMHRQLIAVTSTSVDRRRLDLDKLQLAMSNPETYCERFAEWINSWQEPALSVDEPIKYLRPIPGAESLILDPTDGKATIAKSSDLFNGFLDSDFKNYGCDVESKPTAEQNVQVHELIKNGKFDQIYKGLDDDLDLLCLTQPQIIQFVQKHRKWLRTDGYGTFFLFKVGTEFFVAQVYVVGRGQLRAIVRRFSFGFVWGTEDRIRFVFPQLVS